jgi:chemotaxis signal transduction protein
LIAADRFLVVRSGGARYGLSLDAVREVVDIVTAPRPVPARSASMRGVLALRERHVSLIHLASLVAGGSPPGAVGDTAVVVVVDGAPMALEVDDVESVVDRTADYVGAAPVAWASGVWRVGADLVTVLDLGVLAERILHSGSGQ